MSTTFPMRLSSSSPQAGSRLPKPRRINRAKALSTIGSLQLMQVTVKKEGLTWRMPRRARDRRHCERAFGLYAKSDPLMREEAMVELVPQQKATAVRLRPELRTCS
jgi:hypothetical protein